MRYVRGWRVVCAALVAALAAGCGTGEGERLADGADSVDALGRGVVEALARQDTAGLARYRVTMREHNELLWPRFPAAKGDSPVSLDFAWQNLEMRNAAAVQEWMGSFTGRRVRYDGTQCTGDVEDYETFQILRGCTVTVTDLAQNRPFRISPFDRIVRMDGVHKVIRYVEVD